MRKNCTDESAKLAVLAKNRNDKTKSTFFMVIDFKNFVAKVQKKCFLAKSFHQLLPFFCVSVLINRVLRFVGSLFFSFGDFDIAKKMYLCTI